MALHNALICFFILYFVKQSLGSEYIGSIEDGALNVQLYRNTSLTSNNKSRSLDELESLSRISTGGPSLTQILHHHPEDTQDEGQLREYFQETVPDKYLNTTTFDELLNRPKRGAQGVATTCINPITSKVEECIEKMDKKVAEKCLPGLNNILDQVQKSQEENKVGPYSIETKESEVCLRDIFSDCTYESRFRIKTKIKQLVGVNLDIGFQEEFEMDCCDKEFMQEVIDNTKECFSRLNKDLPEIKCDKDEQISTELLKVTGKCLEDHTAFTCVVQIPELFKDTMRELIVMLRNETLQILKQIGEDKYPHGRLCLKWIDYDRLENCEADFFDYVLCLKNGTHVKGLYEKVVDCLQKALRVCHLSTVKLIIKIIAGAMEGHGGEDVIPPGKYGEEKPGQNIEMYPTRTYGDEKPGQNIQVYPTRTYGDEKPGQNIEVYPTRRYGDEKDILRVYPTRRYGEERPPGDVTPPRRPSRGPCTEAVIEKWLREAKQCVDEHGRNVDNEAGVESKLQVFHQCLAASRPSVCRFHKASDFINAATRVTDIITDTFAPGREKTKRCIEELKNPKMKQCLASLFLYFVSIHHAHYTKEQRMRLLYKAELCFKVLLKSCSKGEVNQLLRTNLVVLKVPFPRIEQPIMVSRVTIPEGYVWCETRIVSSEFPIPPTEQMTYPPRTVTHRKVITPTTVRRIKVPPRTRVTEHRPPPIRTRVFTYPIPPREISRFKTPTTTLIRTVTPPRLTRFRTFPTPPTRQFTFLPPTLERLQRVTPSTMQTFVFTITPKRITHVEKPGRTRIFTYPIRPVTRETRITPTTIKRVTLTIPTFTFRRTRTAQTRVFTVRPRPIEHTQEFPLTTEHFIQPVPSRVVSFTFKPPVPPTFRWTPPTRRWTREHTVRGTTTRKIRYPVPTVPEQQSVGTTKIRFILKEVEIPRRSGEYRPTTRMFTWKPPGRETEQIIYPTTSIIKYRTPPVIHRTRFVPTRPTKIFTFPARPTMRTVYRKPTTYRPFTFIPPVGTRRKTFPSPFTFVKIITPAPITWSRIRKKTTTRLLTVPVRPIEELQTRKPTSIQVHLIEYPRKRYPVQTRTPSPIRKITYTPPEKLIRFTFLPSTVRHRRVTVKPKPHTFTAPMPFTRIFKITPPCIVVTHFRPPTTSRMFTRTPPPRIKIKTRPPPTVEVFTLPPKTHVFTAHRPPTRFRKVTIPIIEHLKKITRPPPQPIVSKWPPRPRTHVMTYTPTTVKKISIPVRPETVTAFQMPTSIRIKIIEKERRTELATRPPRVTCIITFRPPETPFSRIYTIPPVKTVKYPISVQEIHTRRPVPGTRVFSFTPPGRYFTNRIEKPSTWHRRFTIPSIKITRERPYPTTRIERITPPAPTYTRRRIPTTVRYISVPQRPEVHTEKQLSTTIRIRIKEEKVPTRREEIRIPTEEFVFPPDTFSEEQRRTPTTVRRFPITFPSRTIVKIRTPPRTRVFTFTPPTFTGFVKITPTTFSEIEIRPTRRHTKIRPPPRTHYFTVPPRPRERTEIIRPTTRIRWTQPPRPRPTFRATWPPRPPRTIVHTRPPIAWGTRRTFRPKTVTYPAAPEEFVCEYPTPPSTTICTQFVSSKICVPGEEIAWREKILNCTMAQLQKEGKTIYMVIIKEKNVLKLEKIVKQCINWIGDTTCRERTFPLNEWMLKKVITYAGEYGEHADKIGDNELLEKMKKCVIMASESRVEKCIPGFYQVLNDIIIYEKPTRFVEIPNKSNGQCLQDSFRHCKPFVKKKMEELLEKVFGYCIRISDSGESGCQSGTALKPAQKPGKRECTEEELREIKKAFTSCVENEVRKVVNQGGELVKSKILDIINNCKGKQACTITKSPNLIKITKFLVSSLIKYSDFENRPVPYKPNQVTLTKGCDCDCEYTGGTCNNGECECPRGQEYKESIGCATDKCLEYMVSDEYQQCLELVEKLHPNDKEKNDQDKIIKEIVTCVSGALKECHKDIIQRILKFLITSICPDCPEGPYEISQLGSRISSIKVTKDGMDVCSSFFRTDEPPSRPEIEDDCVAVEGEKGSKQVLLKACREERVTKWLAMIKECVEKKVTNIGLRNPDYLTLEKVILILKECVSDKGSLNCRAKYREDFKRIGRVLLQLVTTNVLADTSKGIRNTLTFDKIGNKCKAVLFKYFTFDTKPDAIKKSQQKAVECLRKCVNGPAAESLEDLIDVFDMAMVMDEEKILNLHQRGVLPQCNSASPFGGEDKAYFYNAPSYINCGPGGILVRKERNIEKQLFETSVFIQNIASVKPPHLKSPRRVERASPNNMCTTEDYTRYFDKLRECGQKRLHLKFRRKRNKCKLHDLKHSWTAMVDCMIENIGGELSCQVTTEEQMTEFLQHVAKTLHISLQNNIDDDCPVQGKCYGMEAPALFTCSKPYLQLLKAKTTSIPIREIFEWSSKVLECLYPIWPKCPIEVQFSSLNFLYLPLGLNYDSSIDQGLTFVSCAVNSSHDNSSFHHCQDQIEGGNKNPGSSVESCINCVKKKEGICASSNDTELVDSLREEFSRISRCLKNFIEDDNCLKDITTRVQEKCLPEFYRLYKNITKGIVLNSIEYFGKFNNCLMDFTSYCPASYQKFVIHLYYDVLGLSSFLKPQLPYAENPN